MRKRTWFIILVLVALAASSVACGLASPEPQPTDTAMGLPTDTPVPTDTPTPVPTDTPTPSPTDTPMPTPTGTPEPTDTPEPAETPETVSLDVALDGEQIIRLPARSVAIYNLVGNVEVVPGTGDAIEVEIHPGGKDADSLRVEAGEIDGRQTLRVIYPSDLISVEEFVTGKFATFLQVRDDGTFGKGVESGGRRVTLASGSDWSGFIVPSGPRLEAYAHLTIRVPSGCDLEFSLALGETEVRQVQGASIYTSSADVTVRDVQGKAEVESVHGNVTVRNVQGGTYIEGRVKVKTTHGDVTVHDVQGEADIESSHGDLLLEGITKRVHAKTIHGEVTVRDVQGEADVESSHGDLLLEGIIKRVHAKTSRGSIALDLGDQFAGKLELSTGTRGTIEIDLPDAQVVSSDEHEKTLVLAHGDEISTVRTESGTIYVRRGD